ncbi:hypothetical protein BDN70DRAFT_936145 [Pholiota conissans]|uniref:DUF6534 domain-containing protein n=1 Tax=Pholiota conissans TaxID=109636 RepID=A0A9P5YTZ6_9AGAR|nr:hypothetical protein BDN70DRAFT_936145 [Pholiota conissans]
MPQSIAGGYNVGAELVGTFINLVLYGVELFAAYAYFSGKRFKRDRKFIKLAVVTNLIIDTAASFALCANIFMLFIIDWGMSTDSLPINWAIPLWIFTTGIGEIVVEAFMTQRYYRLSPNYIITTVIVLFMMLSPVDIPQFSGCLYFGVVVSRAIPKIRGDQLDDTRAVTINLASTFVTDICITCALTWELLYREKTLIVRTRHLVRRIAAFAVVTGTVTSAVSLAALIPFLIKPIGGVSPCFGFFLGRVYTLTMLFTLLFRERLSGKAFTYIDFEEELNMTTEQAESPNFTLMSIDTSMVFASPPSESPTNSIHGNETKRRHSEDAQKKERSSSPSRNSIPSEVFSNMSRAEQGINPT